MPVKLGSLELAAPFMLAPLESVSDAAFRRLCWEQGAAFTWTEMIRARGLVRNNKSTIDLIDTFDADVPTGVQLMVVNERELADALAKIETLANTSHPHFKNLSAVDLNFGCPSPEVIRVGAGPALLKRRSKLELLFKTLSGWKKSTSLPIGAVGAKIRLGLNRPEQDQRVYLSIVELANQSLDYLTIHARHARQDSSEPAYWPALADAKARATIPLWGNGDVASVDDFERLIRSTGVDGAMIARAAIRSPYIFRALSGRGPATPTSLDEIDGLERSYQAWSSRFGTKPKFLAWHAEGFERMRKRLGGQRAEGADLPANEHMR